MRRTEYMTDCGRTSPSPSGSCCAIPDSRSPRSLTLALGIGATDCHLQRRQVGRAAAAAVPGAGAASSRSTRTCAWQPQQRLGRQLRRRHRTGAGVRGDDGGAVLELQHARHGDARARRRRAGDRRLLPTFSAWRRSAAASSRPRRTSPGASRSSSSAIASGASASAPIPASSAARFAERRAYDVLGVMPARSTTPPMARSCGCQSRSRPSAARCTTSTTWRPTGA